MERRWSVLPALLLCAGAVLAQSGPDPAAPSLQLLSQHEFPAAVAAADRALAAHPGDCRLLTVRGLALKAEGNPAEAFSSFQQALRGCPDSLPALEGAAQIAYQRHSPAAAPLLRKILAAHPENLTAHAMLAALDVRAGDCAGAIPHFRQSLPLVESNPAAEREYGACLLDSADWQDAVLVFTHLLQQMPTEANRLALASVQLQAGQGGAALSTLQPLLSAPSPSARVLRVAADAAENNGDTPRAVGYLRQAIGIAPADIDTYLSFATLSFTHSSYQVGIDMLNLGLTKNPDSAPLYLARGVLLVQLSRFDAALRDFSRAHALDPRLSLTDDAVGMMRSQQHQPQGALEIYRKAVTQHPQDGLLQYLYAEALSEQSAAPDSPEVKSALAAARRAVALEPTYQPARDLLCTLYVRSQQFAKAVDEAEQARRYQPQDQQALYQEIMAERHLGDQTRIKSLVATLNQLRSQEQGKRTQYVLQEASSQPAVTR
jgi:tetratricopeptide (TPR) repeat protein